MIRWGWRFVFLNGALSCGCGGRDCADEAAALRTEIAALRALPEDGPAAELLPSRRSRADAVDAALHAGDPVAAREVYAALPAGTAPDAVRVATLRWADCVDR